MIYELYNTAHPLAESGKPIFIPFGEWPYDKTTRQRLDREHGEAIANELNERVARGEPGIPVYQGHPDVPGLAAKYPDKGALGWVTKIALANENGKDGLALTVEWDRDPGKGFKWFSPYWFANEKDRDDQTYIVANIRSIGLVNNPNIREFRLANEAGDNNTNTETKGTDMNREELIQAVGLPPEATDDQIKQAIAEGKDAKTRLAELEARATAAVTAETAAKTDAELAKKETDDAKRAFENERSLRADMALDQAIADGRIGKDARTAWRDRLVKNGDFAALANEKPLAKKDLTKGLVNECSEDSEKRRGLVNEIMKNEGCNFQEAWNRAAAKSPALFAWNAK